MRAVQIMWIATLGYSMYVFSDQKIVYQSVTSGEKTMVQWQVKETEEDVLKISGISKGSDIEIECSRDFFLNSYSEKMGAANSLSLTKEGKVLIVDSQEKGKQKLKSYKIGDTPWVQDFKFGLQTFLGSKDKSYNFYILNPKDLALHEMVATKDLEEVLDIGDKKYNAQRVKITLTGFKKKFWKAMAWFDKESLLLIKYRANEGPGTPYTEVTLLEKNGS